ncbi:MAG: hypothetical protein D5R97_06370 [Candidatus Syntrophonatronum acetioxidans]|uniref:Uncharacterized protein n=1 Tax=Candidatus Syntrophonatronum acetioxidans TaxID=1795816 RepID=A0A424YCY7_9FIRM|nr:MAG: hypothetical protein D5R97_06370 [Candidatus Syntrophonatronum acetioxidans]
MVKLLRCNFLFWTVIGLVVVNGCIFGIQEKEGQEDFSQKERQMIMEDVWPDGCLSCHRVEDEDRTIGVYVNNNIEGHPVIGSKYLVECMGCHGLGEEDFGRRLHASHMKSRLYTEFFNSGCLGCHQMNDEGKVFVKGLE